MEKHKVRSIGYGVLGGLVLWFGGGELAEHYGRKAGEGAKQEITERNIDLIDEYYEHVRERLVEDIGELTLRDVLEGLDGKK